MINSHEPPYRLSSQDPCRALSELFFFSTRNHPSMTFLLVTISARYSGYRVPLMPLTTLLTSVGPLLRWFVCRHRTLQSSLKSLSSLPFPICLQVYFPSIATFNFFICSISLSFQYPSTFVSIHFKPKLFSLRTICSLRLDPS